MSPKASFRQAVDKVFVADSVLAKHDENYMPKEVADRLKEQGRATGRGKEEDPMSVELGHYALVLSLATSDHPFDPA